MNIVFDEPDVYSDEFLGSEDNENVYVVDRYANNISHKMYDHMKDNNYEIEPVEYESFCNYTSQHRSSYEKIVKDNYRIGRLKQDYYVPFPSSLRDNERDLISEFRMGHTEYSKIGLALDGTYEYLTAGDLLSMNISSKFDSVREEVEIGSTRLGETEHLYKSYSEHLCSKDTVTCNLQYLYENYSPHNSLRTHEDNNIDCYKPVCEEISKTRLCSYTLYLRRLAEGILSESKRIPKNCYKVRTFGDSRIISIMSRSSLSNNESGPLVSFIIKMTQNDLDVYNQFKVYKTLFCDNSGDHYVYVPPRSFSLVDCTRMIKSNYYLLAFPLQLLDKETKDLESKIRSTLILLVGLIQKQNSEVFTVLSNFRYIMPGILSPLHNIGDLVIDKFPKHIRSPFTDYIINGVLNWMDNFKKGLSVHDRSRKVIVPEAMEDFEVEFSCILPYVNFMCEGFSQYLTVIYLVSMSEGKNKLDRHVHYNLSKTLLEWEDKYRTKPNEFNYDKNLIGKLVTSMSETVKPDLLPLENTLAKYMRTKGTLDESNNPSLKLFDKVIDELKFSYKVKNIGEYIRNHKTSNRMRMAARDDHSGEREIFITTLPSLVAINLIESVAHSVCEQLQSEHITLGGERKFQHMQKEAQNAQRTTVQGWYNVMGSEDASKWSTSDNPEILCQILENLLLNEPEDIKSILINYIMSMKGREVLFQGKHKEYLSNKFGSDYLKLNIGWPQGFFNKLSSLKHYLCYCLGISMFKLRYHYEAKVKISFAVHSDDSRHRFSCDDPKYARIGYLIFLECMSWAKRQLLIRPNWRKSFYGGPISEYLSNFQFHGSLFVPVSKFILNIFGDLSGSGYAGDTYTVMERVRECMRYNCGTSMGSFLMKYASNYVLRLYSMLPGMRGYDQYRNTPDRIIELGGTFKCHPIFLMFLGCKAHDILNYSSNKENIAKLIEHYKDEIDISESSPNILYEHFIPIPTTSWYKQANIKRLIRKYGKGGLTQDETWKILYLQDMSNEDVVKIGSYLLSTPSIARSYSYDPEGMVYARVKQSWDMKIYKHNDNYYKFWEIVKMVESKPGKHSIPRFIEDMLRSSPTMVSILDLENVENIYFDDACRSLVTSGQLNNINIMNPGSLTYRYMKYAFSECLELDVNVPDFVDLDVLNQEVVEMKREIDDLDITVSNKEIMTLYKLIGLSNTKPKYLHLNKHIRDPSAVDMYELVSLVLGNYSQTLLGKVKIGKFSTVSIGDRKFRPEYISMRKDQMDEIKTAARILSLVELYEGNIEKFKKHTKIGQSKLSIDEILQTHPIRCKNLNYYIDYIYLCVKFGRIPKNFDKPIYYTEIDGVKYYRYNKSIACHKGYDIYVHGAYESNSDLSVVIGACYLSIEINSFINGVDEAFSPISFVKFAPQLYFKYKTDNCLNPSFSFEGQVIRKRTGYSTKYLDSVRETMIEQNIIDSIMLNTEEFEYWQYDTSVFEVIKSKGAKAGYAYSSQGCPVALVGETAKFSMSCYYPNMDINGVDIHELLESGYFQSDDTITFQSGYKIPNPYSANRYLRKIEHTQLKKEDYLSVCKFWEIIKSTSSDKSIASTKSFSSFLDSKSLYDLARNNNYFVSETSHVLTPKAMVCIGNFLVPIRCSYRHISTLAKIKHKLIYDFEPLDYMKNPKRSDLIRILQYTAALIGISQDVIEPVEGKITSTEYSEFAVYNSYSGCRSSVWNDIFLKYMDQDDYVEDW